MPIFAVSSKKGAVLTIAIYGVKGLILTKLANDIATILPLNIFNENFHIPNRFGMPACRMKVILPILPQPPLRNWKTRSRSIILRK